jgi:hypothetical protein
MSSLGPEQSLRLTSGGPGAAHVILDVVGYYVPVEATADGGLFAPLQPVRIHDSRNVSGGTLEPGRESAVPVSAAAGIPAGATAFALNVTAVPTGRPGYLAVVPGSAPADGVSTVNWTQGGPPVANGITVGTGPDGAVKVRAGPASTDFVIDVVGFFAPASATPGGALFHPTAPARLHDSRWGAGPHGSGTVTAVGAADGRSGDGIVTSRDIVPAGARALAYNATVTQPTGQGFLSVLPGDADPASAQRTSTLNWVRDTTVPNGSIGRLDAQRRVLLGVAGSDTHVVLDVVGYFE